MYNVILVCTLVLYICSLFLDFTFQFLITLSGCEVTLKLSNFISRFVTVDFYLVYLLTHEMSLLLNCVRIKLKQIRYSRTHISLAIMSRFERHL